MEKLNPPRRFCASIKDTGEQSNYHTTHDSAGKPDRNRVEQALARTENEHCRLLARLDNRLHLDEPDLDSLCLFISLLRYRVPSFKKHLKGFVETAAEHMLRVRSTKDRMRRALDELDDSSWKRFSQAAQNELLRRIEESVKDGRTQVEATNSHLLWLMFCLAEDRRPMSIYKEMGWTFVKPAPECKARFLTCDQPVSVYRERGHPTHYRGAGLIDRDVELTIPLSPLLLLRLDWSKRCGSVEFATDEGVGELNRRTTIMAERFVYAPMKDSISLRQVAENSTYFAGSEFTKMSDGDDMLMLSKVTPVCPLEAYA